MTVSSTTARNQYTGDGTVATYPYTFRAFDATDLLVVKKDTAGNETLLNYGTDYTVTGAGSYNGGTITLTAGNLTTGYTLSIRRILDLLQSTDLRNQGSFLAEVHERVFDRLVMIAQQQQDELDRALKLPESDSSVILLPTKEQRANKALSFDVNGDPTASSAPASGAISAPMQPVTSASTLAAARSEMGPWNDALVTATGAGSERNLADHLATLPDSQLTTTATGGVPLNVKDHISLLHSAKALGAKGDGINDDSDALIAGLAAGKCLMLTPGTYKITKSLIMGNGSGLVALSPGVVIRQFGTGYNAITIPTGVHDWTVSGINLYGASVSTATYDFAVACAAGNDSRRGNVLNNYIHGFNNGVLTGNGSSWTITGNKFESLIGKVSGTGYGVLCAEFSSGNIIKGNAFIGTSSNGRHAVYLSVGATFNLVEGNIIQNFNHSAIACWATSAQSGVSHNVIRGNLIEGGGDSATPEDGGIFVGGKSTHNVIECNTVRGFQNAGITISDAGQGGLTADTIVRSNTVFNSGYVGIDVLGANRTQVIGNTVRNSSTISPGTYADTRVASAGTFGTQLCTGTKFIGNILGGGVGRVAFSVNASVPLPTMTILANNLLMASGTAGWYIELSGATVTDSNNTKNDGP